RVDGTQVITAGIQKVWVFDLSTLVSVEEAPAEAGPLSVYPNPTRDYATVQFSMTEPGRMQVMLHDVLGREIALVEEGTRAAGTHRVRVATASLAAGVYVVRAVMAAESGGESRTFTRRVTLLRWRTVLLRRVGGAVQGSRPARVPPPRRRGMGAAQSGSTRRVATGRASASASAVPG